MAGRAQDLELYPGVLDHAARAEHALDADRLPGGGAELAPVRRRGVALGGADPGESAPWILTLDVCLFARLAQW
jgi:hypothetical protein